MSGGWAFPGEGSDLFTETRRLLMEPPSGDPATTLEDGPAPGFDSFLVQAEAGVRVTERLDAALDLEYAASTAHTVMREWLTADDQWIPQTTEFNRTRLMGSVRWYLLPRGRSLAEYVWVPNAWSPYVGAGLGVAWYDFVQKGDFVDFQTLDIFESRLQSEGTGFTQHVLAGADVSVSARLLLRGEYRYIWGSAPVEQDVFQGFDDIDLSGSRLTVGVALRM